VAVLLVICGAGTASAQGGKIAPARPAPVRETLTFIEASTEITRAVDASASDETTAPGTVLSVAVSPDGKTLALGGENPAVLLRDAKTNRSRAVLTAHAEPVTCLAFSPDGTTLASGSFDRLVKLWDVATGSERVTLQGHAGWICALAFSADGQAIATAGQDGTVRLWDARAGRPLATFSGHEGSIRALAFSPDGQTLASAGADRVVRLWDVPEQVLKLGLAGHRGAVRALAFSPDEQTLASAGEDHSVKLWDVVAGKSRATLAGHTDLILALAFSPRGTGLATGGYDAVIRVWDAAGKPGPLDSLRGHAEGVTALAFNPATGELVSAGFDRTVRLWTPAVPIATLKRTIALARGQTIAPAYAHGAVFVPVGNALATFSAGDQYVRIWEPTTGKELTTIGGNAAHVTEIVYSANSARLAISLANQTLRIVETATLEQLGLLSTMNRLAPPVGLAPDGRSVAAGGEQESIAIWDLPSGALASAADPNLLAKSSSFSLRRIVVEPGGDIPLALAYSPDGSMLAVATRSRTNQTAKVSVRDFANGSERASLTTSGVNVIRLAFSRDGKMLAGAGARVGSRNEGSALFWNTASWTEAGKLPLTGVMKPATFTLSPDGARFAMGTTEGSVQFWEAATRKPKGSIKAHNGSILSVSFAPDGKTLATTSFGDDTVKIWELVNEQPK
jgi:WD40 repeat protein